MASVIVVASALLIHEGHKRYKSHKEKKSNMQHYRTGLEAGCSLSSVESLTDSVIGGARHQSHRDRLANYGDATEQKSHNKVFDHVKQWRTKKAQVSL